MSSVPSQGAREANLTIFCICCHVFLPTFDSEGGDKMRVNTLEKWKQQSEYHVFQSYGYQSHTHLTNRKQLRCASLLEILVREMNINW